MGRIFLTMLAIFFILLIIFGLFIAYYMIQIKFGNEAELAKQFYSEKFTQAPPHADRATSQTELDLSFLIYDHSPQLGPADAPITIIAFVDFECPYCQEGYSALNEIIDKYQDSVRVVFKHFPLDEIHPNASYISLISECANEQDKFWPMYDKLFIDSAFFNKDRNLQASELGLIQDQYNQCISSKRYIRQIEQDLIDGTNLGVRGTPTYFVNQTKIEGLVEAKIWNQILMQEIKKTLQ